MTNDTTAPDLIERLRYPINGMRPTLTDGRAAANALEAAQARIAELEVDRDKPATEQQSVKEAAREEVVDEIEEIIGETHDIDVTDRCYAENIVSWMERHHPAALRSLAREDE